MSQPSLLGVSAGIEMGAGAALLLAPSFVASALLGEELTSPESLAVARIAGAALMAIAVACWFGRSGGAGHVAGLLVYNVAVPIILLHGWFALGFRGTALWPATLLHVALGGWCIAILGKIGKP